MRIILPATSANLGPAFDAAALALDRYLSVQAVVAEQFVVHATGRNAEECGRVESNLVLDVYKQTLGAHGRNVLPLELAVSNDIPLGMGMGSSAAARLAGLALAAHFGDLDWSSDRILAEACRLEHHPDNAAACWLGGFVTAVTEASPEGERVIAARFDAPPDWAAIVVVPTNPLATEKARAVLPDSVSLQDAVANLQRSALLTAAFAQQRGDWLRAAMADRLHHPYRAALCPLLPRLLPLAGQHGVMGVALSGAGPAVLLLVASHEAASRGALRDGIVAAAAEPVELLLCRLANSPAVCLP